MSINPDKQPDNKPTEQPKPTDEVRPEIKAAATPMETAEFSEGKTYITMEIRNDSAGSD
jgi:hypothetical protein